MTAKRTYNAKAGRLRALASWLDSGGDPDLIRIMAEGEAEEVIVREHDREVMVSRFVD